MTKHSTSEIGYMCAAFTLLIWASFPVVSRMAGTGVLTLFDVMALRLGVASLALSYWWVPRLLNASLRQLSMKQILSFSMVAGLTYPLVAFTAMRFAPASHGAVILSGALPLLTAAMSYQIWKEKPGRVGQLSLILVFIGVALLLGTSIWRTGFDFTMLLGDTILLAASAVWALFTILLKYWKARAFDVTLAAVAVASMIYLPVYVVLLPSNFGQASWGEILFQASYQGLLVPVVAMFTYARAIEYLGAVKTVTLLSATPVVGTVMAVGFLGEVLYPGTALGAMCVFVGATMGAMVTSSGTNIQVKED